MKYGTIRIPGEPIWKTPFPDGRLVQVSESLGILGREVRETMQSALDRGFGGLQSNHSEEFSEFEFAAPLPRAYQFLDASAYVNHVDLVRRARGAEMPERFWADPLMYQGGSDMFLGPCDPITGDPAWGIDFEAEIAVITDLIEMGSSRDEAAGAIRLVMLLNDISLRNLIPDELLKGFGFVQSKPACACSPVAVTPDALPGWDGGKLHGTLCVDLNGAPFGRAEAGEDMTFDFGVLLAHAAKTRHLGPGTVLGSGTVSNRDADGGPGRPVADGGRGYSCIAEQRMVETLRDGAPSTEFLKPGDRVKIWMNDDAGNSIFGEIYQTVAPWEGA
ncbi:fumarylacetoacetate hydrolase family protein [Ovoidimarina sediminis]|uniref:fumarylacetoacetate hydrolase family protein n=1 Tax=Ovoidimarina sediminis TaxID=3079856 RepID=UPI0029115434|nr:fumarylacetoacetate hydrolase family protein [Rhodophyticola sp. MJ-SS7]MDU8942208.1 fumarylacetoacetate hydrolase family protein [Rhodophyticola sp. MJ-SS7]